MTGPPREKMSERSHYDFNLVFEIINECTTINIIKSVNQMRIREKNMRSLQKKSTELESWKELGNKAPMAHSGSNVTLAEQGKAPKTFVE